MKPLSAATLLLAALLCAPVAALAALKAGDPAPPFKTPAAVAGQAFDFDLSAALGATVVGISHDDIDTLKRFSREECRDRFAVGSDPAARTIKAYDAGSLLPGMASRISYVVGQDGKIAFTHEGSNPIKHVEQTLEAVRRLKK